MHVHTPASHDFVDKGATREEILAAARAAGLDVIAITDHNTGSLLDDFAEHPAHDVAVFPGVELTSQEGAHLLVLFEIGSSADVVKAFLGRCNIPGTQFGMPEARAAYGYGQCVKMAHEAGGLCIAAHANRPAPATAHATSLLHVLREGGPLSDVLGSRHLHAVELASPTDEHRRLMCFDGATGNEVRPPIASSDAHTLEQIGRGSTWIKMTTPSLEGLRLAFADGQSSVLPHDGSDPNRSRAPLRIESVEIAAAKLMGRPEPLVVAFNPWLNTIIGGRGTGKSSVVEFLRIGLDRMAEVPESLAKTFRDFAQVPSGRNGRGMLTASTSVRVTYRKDDTLFRIRWANGHHELEQQAQDGSWEPTQGSVLQRFPVRLYSQKQIFEMAEGPAALLHVIDASAQVDRPGWDERWSKATRHFLTCRAQAREISAALADRARLVGELDDVKRKLAVFEASDHRTVLRTYAQHQDQKKAVATFDGQLDAVPAQIREIAAGLAAKLEQQTFSAPNETVVSGLLDAAQQQTAFVEGIARRLESLAGEAETATARWVADPRRTAWMDAVNSSATAYTQLMTKLQTEGAGDPDQYAALVSRRQGLEERLRQLSEQDSELQEIRTEATQALRTILDLRRELTTRRVAFLSTTLANNRHVRIDVVPYGDRDSAEFDLRQLLNTFAFANDIASADGKTGVLVELFRGFDAAGTGDIERRLAQLRVDLAASAAGGAPTLQLRDKRFGEHLRALPDETIDRIAYWAPEDSVRVSYSRDGDGQNFRPIEQGSPGQKTAAILAFLLAHGDEPVILDQPEDDLDNLLIYDLVVRQVRANKLRRQIVVVTHNANIVVNGDAEHVLVMGFPAHLGQTTIERAGGLQEEAIREQICAIMEGGRTAFEQRYRRIGQHSQSDADK